MTDLCDTLWDVIVIGTGIGGGTIGRRLAEGGASVLFLEQGPAGAAGEEQGLDPRMWDPVARQARGYWPKPVEARVNGCDLTFHAPLGAGVGGSSVFYAATLERPARHDLDQTETQPHPTGGWPVGYDAMLPYFTEVERLYHITGGADPLDPAPAALPDPTPMTEREATLKAAFEARGLHPYQAHLALRNVPDCQSCFGFKCRRRCKMDGRSAGVEPALATGNATLLAGACVERIAGKGNRVTHVEARVNGTPLCLRAKAFVLAGGALASPGVLLRSASEDWPAGAANSSGLVGRNLMFHLTEMLALWPPGASDGTPSKALVLRDFYTIDGQRMGLLQAMGIEAGYGEITHFLNSAFDRSALRGVKPLRHLTRVPAAIAARMFGSAMIFAAILEDMPHPKNRVLPTDDPDTIHLRYDIPDELMNRRRLFRRHVRKALGGLKPVFLNLQPDLNFGHPCGTLRFGDDPATSVLRPDCRSHDLRNLYLADSSFMPTSTGANPSLMIAAMALRTGDHLLRALKEGELP
ncbi:GMC oxidoreductase [Shimia biformata]|uniref:GMC oxidoreductase n=1 Tax=Shimia biformata TaxID=1294299 RepID=UPI001950003F|nr:GMC family oxidoreductase [Shimia biformata]